MTLNDEQMEKLERWYGIRPWKRHSLVLFISGLVYIGVGMAITQWVPGGPRAVAVEAALNVAPFEFWGSVFMLAGGLACLSSRWPVLSEKWGYSVLTGLSAGWSATYAASVIVGDSPSYNLSGALTWGLIAFLWWSISGLMNPDKITVVVMDGSS